MSIPSATYRLQLRREFGFAEVHAVASYLSDLGISHLYLSPITTAVPGSTHGYDVVDPTRLSPDLGGEPAYRALTAELRQLGIGQVLDVVPNHMGAATENRWWVDVLRRGAASPYARVYDIDWQASTAGGTPRVLLPILGDRLERELERGEIVVEAQADGGAQLRYWEAVLPLAPESLVLLGATDEGQEALHDAAERMTAERTSEAGRAALRALLDAQHYRLALWHDAKPRVNYRRFFVIDQLIGVRAEDPAVFGVTHALALRLASEGAIDGLRIDHVDGLADPAAYLSRLQDALRAGIEAVEAQERVEPYLVVEKILAEDEALPDNWRCHGTSGYDFMRDVNAVFVDTAAERAMTELFADVTGERRPFEEIAYEARRAVVDGPLAGQLRAVTSALFEASGATTRGITAPDFDAALRTLLASLDVYRTYHSGSRLDPEARRHVDAARASATGRLGGDGRALAFVAELIAQPPEHLRATVERLQQLMPTVQAKGIEDAAAYRYPRLLSLSEVGTSPGTFGIDVDAFHARNVERARRWPDSMLATATHDDKRGEDVRARLNVLAEMPDALHDALREWRAHTARVRPDALDAMDEYVAHQTLMGSWPVDPLLRRDEEFTQRVQDYLVKFAREAGTRSSWDAPDEAYEEALRVYAGALTDPAATAEFQAARATLQERVSRLGVVNSLGQVVLRCMSPGVPDTYQGTEGWDLSLVDPDNRRPVDYRARESMLDGLRGHLEGPSPGRARALIGAWRDGGVKMAVLAALLRRRRAHAPAFREATYEPLEVRGERARHVIAFTRRAEGLRDIVLVTRLPAVLLGDSEDVWSPEWRDTVVEIPGGGSGRDLFTGRVMRAPMLEVSAILDVLPVAVLRMETR